MLPRSGQSGATGNTVPLGQTGRRQGWSGASPRGMTWPSPNAMPDKRDSLGIWPDKDMARLAPDVGPPDQAEMFVDAASRFSVTAATLIPVRAHRSDPFRHVGERHRPFLRA